MKLNSVWIPPLPGGLFNSVEPLVAQAVLEIDFPGRNEITWEQLKQCVLSRIPCGLFAAPPVRTSLWPGLERMTPPFLELGGRMMAASESGLVGGMADSSGAVTVFNSKDHNKEKMERAEDLFSRIQNGELMSLLQFKKSVLNTKTQRRVDIEILFSEWLKTLDTVSSDRLRWICAEVKVFHVGRLRCTKLERSLNRDLAVTQEIIQRAKELSERLSRSKQMVPLWLFTLEVMSATNQDSASCRYRTWKKSLSPPNLKEVEQYEEVATGKKPMIRSRSCRGKYPDCPKTAFAVAPENSNAKSNGSPESAPLQPLPSRNARRFGKKEETGLDVPPIRDYFFHPTPSTSQKGYLSFLRARTMAINKKVHGIQTDFLRFQRVVTGLHHERNPIKLERAYQAWLLGLEANSRLQVDYYAAIIRGEDPASLE